MYIELNEDEAQVVIDALAVMAKDYRTQAGEAKGYSLKSRNEIAQCGINAHDLCLNISEQLQSYKRKEEVQNNEPKKIDPFSDPDWRPNDPRGW